MQPDPTSPLDLTGSLLAALLGRYGEACVVADQEGTKLRHDEAEAAYEAIKAQHSTLLADLAEAQRERDEACGDWQEVCRILEETRTGSARLAAQLAAARADAERKAPVVETSRAVRAHQRRPLPPGTTKEELLAMVEAYAPIARAFEAALDHLRDPGGHRMIGDAMYEVPGSRLREMSDRITELTARAERAEAAEADLRATVERVRHEANCWSFLDDESVTVDELRDRILAELDSTTPPPSPEGEGAEDPIERDRAHARAEVELVQRWWVRDEAGYTYRVVGPKAAAKVKADGWGGVKREEFEVVYDFEFRPSSSRYFPAALDGGRPDTPAPTEEAS